MAKSSSGRGRSSSESQDSQEFESPGGDRPEQNKEADENQRFASPSSEDLGAAAVEAEAAAIEAELDDDMVALKGELDKKLSSDVSTDGQTATQDLDGSNIVGVGFGYADADPTTMALSNNVRPGEMGLVVFTIEPTEPSAVLSEISGASGSRALSTAPIIQVPVGVVDAYSHRMRLRPAPGGISVGHFAITAGTLGCLCTGLTAPRNSRLMVLSNNHVLANSNAATLGDCICQPGPADGGRCPPDQIAILERFVPINFSGGVNYVDAATAWAWPDRVRRELMYLSGSTPVYFRAGTTPVAATVGMLVGKTGRTTQLKQGRVTAVNVTVNVNYGGGRIGHFRDQISIVGTTAAGFSAGGDSGSLIWRWDTGRAPVGLLFAGGGGTTFGNRITRVLSALDVRLY